MKTTIRRSLLSTCLSFGTLFAADPITLEEVKGIRAALEINPMLQQSIQKTGIGTFRIERVDPASLTTLHSVAPGQGQDQGASGRCWIFSGLELLSEEARKIAGGEFTLSKNYIAFWDKFERSLYYIQKMYEFAKEDKDIRSDEIYRFEREICGKGFDGGHWNFLANIVKKYGVVPDVQYPDKTFSALTEKMNSMLTEKLGVYKATIFDAKLDERKDLDTVFKEVFQEAKRDIFTYLCYYLGTPPMPDEEFAWSVPKQKAINLDTVAEEVDEDEHSEAEYESGDEDEDPEARLSRKRAHVDEEDFDEPLQPRKRKVYSFTPLGFAKFLGADPDNYILFSHLPYHRNEDGSVVANEFFQVNDMTNMIGGAPFKALQLELKDTKEILRDSIRAGVGVKIACDIKDVSNTIPGKSIVSLHGAAEREVLGVHPGSLAKAARLLAGIDRVAHAMYLVGADDEARCSHVEVPGQPCPFGYGPLWHIRNSWGESGKDLYATDEWFDEYAHLFVIRKDQIPDWVLDGLDGTPVNEVPFSDPVV